MASRSSLEKTTPFNCGLRIADCELFVAMEWKLVNQRTCDEYCSSVFFCHSCRHGEGSMTRYSTRSNSSGRFNCSQVRMSLASWPSCAPASTRLRVEG